MHMTSQFDLNTHGFVQVTFIMKLKLGTSKITLSQLDSTTQLQCYSDFFETGIVRHGRLDISMWKVQVEDYTRRKCFWKMREGRKCQIVDNY